MAKRRAERIESASARSVVVQREETRVENSVKDDRHTRVCSFCEFFESSDRGYGDCHRYPQVVMRKAADRACGEWSER